MPITPTLERSAQTANAIDVGPASDDQFEPRLVTLDDGRYVVLWTDDSDAAPGDVAGVDILAQVFDAFGNPVGAVARVNVSWFVDDEHDFSVAALPGGKFVVAYEDEDSDGVSIRADEFTVNADHSLTHDGFSPNSRRSRFRQLSAPQVSGRSGRILHGDIFADDRRIAMDVFAKTVDGVVSAANSP